jgi:hypothetical protein
VRRRNDLNALGAPSSSSSTKSSKRTSFDGGVPRGRLSSGAIHRRHACLATARPGWARRPGQQGCGVDLSKLQTFYRAFELRRWGARLALPGRGLCGELRWQLQLPGITKRGAAHSTDPPKTPSHLLLPCCVWWGVTCAVHCFA